ncbi:MAG: hypothetical protein Q8P81_01715 [Nanoarchaeota archaeon]|nr:hypothetical protein [Nanoarchaeota archaeon]
MAKVVNFPSKRMIEDIVRDGPPLLSQSEADSLGHYKEPGHYEDQSDSVANEQRRYSDGDEQDQRRD